MKTISLLIAAMVVSAGFLFFDNASPVFGYQLDIDQLQKELAEAGIKTGKIGNSFGISFLEAELPMGNSIADICENIPILRENMPETLEVISIANRLHPSLVRGEKEEIFTTSARWVKIITDTTVQADNVFSELEKRLTKYKSYLIVDRARQVLLLYEYGELALFIPVATGRKGWETPRVKGVVLGKAKEFWIEERNLLLCWVTQLTREVCVYGGLMGGHFSTKGDIKTFPSGAEKLFDRIKPGETLFEIR